MGQRVVRYAIKDFRTVPFIVTSTLGLPLRRILQPSALLAHILSTTQFRIGGALQLSYITDALFAPARLA